MGKSLGNTLDPVALSQAYGADAVRFYFMKAIDFGKVGSLTIVKGYPHTSPCISHVHQFRLYRMPISSMG